jgi:hypothetical protein
MSRISYDRTRVTVRIDPHSPHSEGPLELDVLDFIAGNEGEWLRMRRTQWAQLIRKVWQEDPLLCPRCAGSMRIISFITDQGVIDKILRHIGFEHTDAPPARYHPPPQLCRSPLG